MPPHGDSAVKSRCRGEQGRPAERKMLFAPVTVRGRRGSRDRSAQRSARGAARGAGARTCTGEQAETLGASSEPSAGPFAPLMEAETEQGRGRRGPRRTLPALGRSLPCSVSASEGRAKRPAEGSENSPSRRGPPLLLPRSVSASESRAKGPTEGSESSPRPSPAPSLLPPRFGQLGEGTGRGLGEFTESPRSSPAPSPLGLRLGEPGEGTGRGLGKFTESPRPSPAPSPLGLRFA